MVVVLGIASRHFSRVRELFASCQQGWLGTLLLATSTIALYSKAIHAQEPRAGDELPLEFSSADQTVRISFRYCPSGKIKPGKPSLRDKTKAADKDEAGASDPSALLANASTISLRGFYLSETEVTIDQFHKIVGDNLFNDLKVRNARVNKGAPDLIERIQSGGDYPVFMVSLQDCLAFCGKLTELGNPKQAEGVASIEARQFRIPTQTEWQYACRASSNDEAEQQLPHFNHWIDDWNGLDKKDRARCEEEWEAMGKNKGEFRGTQFQVAEILDQRQSDTNPKPLQILTAFLRSHRDHSIRRPASLAHVKTLPPNLWHLYDMHDNVCEWALAISDQGQAIQYWDRLLQADASVTNDRKLYLAGGSFNLMMANSKGAWQQFAIWGGAPMRTVKKVCTGTIEPFSEADEAQYSEDKMPGIRVVMERVLKDDWLHIVRQGLIFSDSADDEAISHLDTYKRTVIQILPQSQQSRATAMLDYYGALGLYRAGKMPDASKRLAGAQEAFGPEKSAKPKLTAADFLAGGNAAAAKAAAPAESEDSIYFANLRRLVEHDF